MCISRFVGDSILINADRAILFHLNCIPSKMPKKSNRSPMLWNNYSGRVSSSTDDKRYDKHNLDHDEHLGKINGKSYLERTKLRVSFKTQRPMKDVRRNITLLDLDEDIPMAGNSSNNNMRQIIRNKILGLSRGRKSPLPNKHFQTGQSEDTRPKLLHYICESDWYRICIPYGYRYEQQNILSALLPFMRESFVPIMYKVIDTSATFYVDDRKVAFSLLSCDRKITMPDGFKLQIKIKPGFPVCEVDDKLKERLKQAMTKRYVRETKALDLSKFHRDINLVSDYFCALFRPAMLMAVLDIVGEYLPNLEALNLEGNKLHAIQSLSMLTRKFPNLKILYIGNNKIKEINQIDSIKELKLEELRLAGNPVCRKYKMRQNDYVSDIRKRFPRLLRLDGAVLPRPIVFDLTDDTAKIPLSVKLSVVSVKGHEVASQFMQQFFAIFDSDNRQPLLDAYSEHACFSITIIHSYSKLNGYFLENRNLFRVNDTVRRCKLLKQGKISIVTFLSEMPKTRHILDSFTMDVTLPTSSMMNITITGCFYEINNKEELIRYFNRTFVIVPEGNGYCICNEQLHISQPTETQMKQLNIQSIPVQQLVSLSLPSVSTERPQLVYVVPEVITQPSTSVAPTVSAVVQPTKPMELTEDTKQQMVITLCHQTGMNLQWSLKCLTELQWNYDNALFAFQSVFKLGKIPAEAFVVA